MLRFSSIRENEFALLSRRLKIIEGTEMALFENPEVAKSTLQTFLSINGEMDAAIVAAESRSSPAEYKAFKRAVGYVMFEVFEKIIEPICNRHPSLKRPEMKNG
jgi:hypothetical protein